MLGRAGQRPSRRVRIALAPRSPRSRCPRHAAVYVRGESSGSGSRSSRQVTLCGRPRIALARAARAGNRLTPGIALGAFVPISPHHEPVAPPAASRSQHLEACRAWLCAGSASTARSTPEARVCAHRPRRLGSTVVPRRSASRASVSAGCSHGMLSLALVDLVGGRRDGRPRHGARPPRLVVRPAVGLATASRREGVAPPRASSSSASSCSCSPTVLAISAALPTDLSRSSSGGTAVRQRGAGDGQLPRREIAILGAVQGWVRSS